MPNLRLHARVTRRGDELVIAIPGHLQPEHVREGDEVRVSLNASGRPVRRPRRQ